MVVNVYESPSCSRLELPAVWRQRTFHSYVFSGDILYRSFSLYKFASLLHFLIFFTPSITLLISISSENSNINILSSLSQVQSASQTKHVFPNFLKSFLFESLIFSI